MPDGNPFTDELRVRLTSPAGGLVRVSAVALAENDRVQETVRVGAKVGRNDPCPCGSGKKYKRCHGK